MEKLLPRALLRCHSDKCDPTRALRRVGEYVAKLLLHYSSHEIVCCIRSLLIIEDTNANRAAWICLAPEVIHPLESCLLLNNRDQVLPRLRHHALRRLSDAV